MRCTQHSYPDEPPDELSEKRQAHEDTYCRIPLKHKKSKPGKPQKRTCNDQSKLTHWDETVGLPFGEIVTEGQAYEGWYSSRVVCAHIAMFTL